MNKKIKKPTRSFLPWVFVLVIVVGVGGWHVIERPVVVEIIPETPPVRRAIDGVWVPEGTPEAYPLSVIIENSVDAWPVSGVNEANLVWEAPVEAGITRLLAMYADGVLHDKLGPVRSARPYFIDWAEEFGAVFAHVGGSPEALGLIPSRNVVDLNEFWNTNYFWRAADRARPHNVYTSTETLHRLVEEEELIGTYESLQYKEDALREARPLAQEVVVVFGNETYTVTWKYDPNTNDYMRWQLGAPYQDAAGELVRAKNVVVMQTSVRVLDAVGRRRITTIGDGPVWVFQDGTVVEGTWRRPEHGLRTRFFGDDALEILLNAGTTWVQVTHLWPETHEQ
jgi:hypothetical protein